MTSIHRHVLPLQAALKFHLSSTIPLIAMTDPEATIHSPLEGSVFRDGRAMEVRIFKPAGSRWRLEVVDDQGTSTVCKGEFDCDQVAYDEAIRFIGSDAEGWLIVRR